MRPSDQDALNRWLAAERDDHAEEAEAALLELFEALPMAAPPAGFADRVLVRAGLVEARVQRDLFAWRPLRLLLAFSLVAVAFGLLWAPAVLRALGHLWSFDGLVQGGLRVLAELTQTLATALRFGELFISVGRALSDALTQPQVMLVLMGCLAVSSFAFRFLRDRVTGERKWNYVDPS